MSVSQLTRRSTSQLFLERLGACVLSFLSLNLSTVVIDSLKLIFPSNVFVGVSVRIQCHIYIYIYIAG